MENNKYNENVDKVSLLMTNNPNKEFTAQDIKKELGCSLKEARMYLSGALYSSLCNMIINGK